MVSLHGDLRWECLQYFEWEWKQPVLCLWDFYSPAYLKAREKMAKDGENCDQVLSTRIFFKTFFHPLRCYVKRKTEPSHPGCCQLLPAFSRICMHPRWARKQSPFSLPPLSPSPASQAGQQLTLHFLLLQGRRVFALLQGLQLRAHNDDQLWWQKQRFDSVCSCPLRAASHDRGNTRTRGSVGWPAT